MTVATITCLIVALKSTWAILCTLALSTLRMPISLTFLTTLSVMIPAPQGRQFQYQNGKEKDLIPGRLVALISVIDLILEKIPIKNISWKYRIVYSP